MGCFNLTCAISNLPITCSDEAAVIFIAQNHPAPDGIPCYTVSNYSPISVPVYCTYDDYGTFDVIDDENERAIADTVVAHLNRHLVELDAEDNSRRPAVKRGNMSWEELQAATKNERLFVRRQGWDGHAFSPTDAPVIVFPILRPVFDALMDSPSDGTHFSSDLKQAMEKVTDMIITTTKAYAEFKADVIEANAEGGDSDGKDGLGYFNLLRLITVYRDKFRVDSISIMDAHIIGYFDSIMRQCGNRDTGDFTLSPATKEACRRTAMIDQLEYTMMELSKGFGSTVGGSQQTEYQKMIDFNKIVTDICVEKVKGWEEY